MTVLSNHQTERYSPSPQKYKPYRKKSITLRAEVCSYDKNWVYSKPRFGERRGKLVQLMSLLFSPEHEIHTILYKRGISELQGLAAWM